MFSVSKDELLKREAKWKRAQARKKRAKNLEQSVKTSTKMASVAFLGRHYLFPSVSRRNGNRRVSGASNNRLL
jgi:hypothetical protein